MLWCLISADPSCAVVMTAIRLVLFDAFSTLLVPRLPVYVQYAQTFEPYLGALEPDKLKGSFKTGR